MSTWPWWTLSHSNSLRQGGNTGRLLQHYGIDTSGPNQRIALRAIIGGGEIGIGLALATGRYFKLEQSSLNFVAASVFLSVGLCRFTAALFELSYSFEFQPWREGAIEIMFGLFALLGFFRSNS